MRSDPARLLARAIGRRGLTAPARLLADAHRPIGPLLADLGAAVGPLARIAGGPATEAAARLFDEPDALDRLVAAIDAGERSDAGETSDAGEAADAGTG